MADYLFLLESRLTPDQQMTIRLLRQVTQRAGINLYLTGGPMRDLLTGTPVRYLDFTVEGNPATLEKPLAASGALWINSDKEEQVLRFRLRGQRARIRAARSAPTPGGNGKPGFHPGTIDEDLRTRGLSLNSIGLSLAEGSHGLLRDPTNGQADIEARLIRMNYPYVFYDDPVFVLRAVRLQTRLQFAIEERTQARIQSALESKYLEKVSAISLGQELEAIAYEPEPAAVLRALDAEGLLEEGFGKGVRASKMNLAALSQLSKDVEAWEQLGLAPDTGLVALPLILGGLATSDQNRLGHMLQNAALAEQWRKIPALAHAFEKKFAAKAGGPLDATFELIEKSPADAVVYSALAPEDNKFSKKLKEFQAKALPLRQRLPVRYLPQLGIGPHSAEGLKILDTLFRRLLRGELSQESEVLAALYAIAGPPPPPPVVKPMPGRRGAHLTAQARFQRAAATAKAAEKAPEKVEAPAAAPPPAKAAEGKPPKRAEAEPPRTGKKPAAPPKSAPAAKAPPKKPAKPAKAAKSKPASNPGKSAASARKAKPPTRPNHRSGR